jgi:glycosyltransferase involved in cell wall biosynthesis
MTHTRTIAYFSNQFAESNGHGIARYAHHLYEAMLPQRGLLNIIPVAAWSDLEHERLKVLKAKTNLQLLPWGRRVTPVAWQYLGFPFLEQGIDLPVDLVHAVSLGYKVATRKPYVVTIHDIGPLTHPQYFTNRAAWIMSGSLRQAIRQADAFICVSQASADDLQYYSKKKYGAALDDRIHVVPEGVDDHFFDDQEKPLDRELQEWLPSYPYILAVGKISPRKNLSRVLNALALVKDKIPHHLIAVGGDGWEYESVKERVRQLKLSNRVHFPGYVSDSVLKQLYRSADVFVYPSLFEGFGLTILEAMASGCPVITSNLSSLPEVAGEAGILINPFSPDEIADALLRLCSSPEIRQEKRNQGINHAKSFSWKSCASSVLDIYNTLL